MIDWEQFEKVFRKCEKIAKDKNKLYGTDSLKSFDGIAMLARANDKMRRIENIITSKEYNRDYINDNIIDIINYMIYYYMYLNEILEK